MTRLVHFSGDTLVSGGATFSDTIPLSYNRGRFRAEVATFTFPIS